MENHRGNNERQEVTRKTERETDEIQERIEESDSINIEMKR